MFGKLKNIIISTKKRNKKQSVVETPTTFLFEKDHISQSELSDKYGIELGVVEEVKTQNGNYNTK